MNILYDQNYVDCGHVRRVLMKLRDQLAGSLRFDSSTFMQIRQPEQSDALAQNTNLRVSGSYTTLEHAVFIQIFVQIQ